MKLGLAYANGHQLIKLDKAAEMTSLNAQRYFLWHLSSDTGKRSLTGANASRPVAKQLYAKWEGTGARLLTEKEWRALQAHFRQGLDEKVGGFDDSCGWCHSAWYPKTRVDSFLQKMPTCSSTHYLQYIEQVDHLQQT